MALLARAERDDMRKIIMFNRVSADGYFADAAGGLSWTVPDDELDQSAAAGIDETDAMLFGRKTYDLFESYWPHATSEDPHAAGRHNDSIRRMAEWINRSAKYVFSETRRSLPWQNSHLLGKFTPEQVLSLKQQPGKSIMLFGSGTIVSLLSRHRLIDEYRLVVSPLLLGVGQSLLRGVPLDLPLRLVDVKRYGSGNITLSYEPAT